MNFPFLSDSPELPNPLNDQNQLSMTKVFLSAIWLPQGQLWATVEGTASLT